MTEVKKQIEKNRAKIKSRIFNLRNLNKLIAVLILILGGYYVVNINAMVVDGFKLQTLQKNLNSLTDLNKTLEYQKMNYESYNQVSQRVKDLKMVAANNVDYIEVANGVVARR